MHDLVSSVPNPEDLPHAADFGLASRLLLLPCLARDALLAKAVVGGLCAVVAAFAMIGWNVLITEVGGWVGWLNVETFMGFLLQLSTRGEADPEMHVKMRQAHACLWYTLHR